MKNNGFFIIFYLCLSGTSLIYHNWEQPDNQFNIDFDEDNSQNTKLKTESETNSNRKNRVLEESEMNSVDSRIQLLSQDNPSNNLFKRQERNLRDNPEQEILSLANDMSELNGLVGSGKTNQGESERAMLSLIRHTKLRNVL